MNVLVLCNVGNRDLVLERETTPSHSAREKGQQMLNRYEEIATCLTFPIIEPCLRYVESQHPEGINHLVLYGTDQPDSIYRANDTLHFAALAARRLPELLGDALKSADWQPIQDINPALYDEAFEKFDHLLASLVDIEVDVCYVAIVGGIPACNTALLLQGVRYFGDRLRVVYQPQGGEPQELRAGQQVTSALREAAAMEHLQRMDFANALPRLKLLGVAPGLTGLVDYAAQRFAFDFRSAQTVLLQTLREGDRVVRQFIQEQLRHSLDPLLKEEIGPQRLKALLRELYWNAVITYRHRRYADFLGRIYRFQEAVLRYLVEYILGLPTDLGPAVKEETKRRWSDEIRANPGLLAFLEAQKVDGGPLEWERIARPTYQALLSYATSEAEGEGLDEKGQSLLSPGERRKYVALLDRINAFDRLIMLRHRTIIGHGFEGISEALLLENYKGKNKPNGQRRTPVEGLKEIMGMLGSDVRPDPYQAVVGFVVQNLRGG